MPYFLLLLTVFFWGATWVAGRVVAQEIAPFTAAFIRFFLASVALWGLVRWREGGLPALPKSQWLRLFFLGATGIFAYNYFFLHGLKIIPAGQGALIVSSLPVLIALCDGLLRRLHNQASVFSVQMCLGIALGLCGNVWVVSNGAPLTLWNGQAGVGELLILGCVFSWLAYTFIGRRASDFLSPLSVNFYACSIGAVMLGVMAVFEANWGQALAPQFHYSMSAWGSLLFLAFLGTTLAYTWFTAGVQFMGATRAGVFLNLVPLFGVLLGALILHERLPSQVLMGGLVTLLGVALTQNFPQILLSNRRRVNSSAS